VVTPYKENSLEKKQQIALMFNNIAHKYDFLNHFLSMGIDKLWRRKAIKMLQQETPENVLDIATGTGDFAIEAKKLKPQKIVGIDISTGMLEVGKRKIQKLKLENLISLEEGDSENLRFEDAHFQAITVGFGVRNFENLQAGLREMHRVLTPVGVAVVLEFSKPRNFPIKQIYNFYFFRILPFFGRLFSKDSSAYTYLPESVQAFPDGDVFLNELKKAGFSQTKQIPLTFGIASIYWAKK